MVSRVLSCVVLCCVLASLSSVHVVSARGTSVRVHRQPHKFTPLVPGQPVPAYDVHHVVKLSGGLLTMGAYFAEVQIGTPPQTFTVLLDTGSSNLAVSASSCTDGACGTDTPRYDVSQSTTAVPMMCDSDACKTCNLHDNPGSCLFAAPFCLPSNTSLCGGSISYGGSSSFLMGPWVTDTVTFGGLTTRTGLMPIEAQLPAASFSGSGLSGILGLAHEWNAVNPTYIPTLFHNLVQDKQVDDLFGLCLTPSSGGSLDLGWADSTKYHGDLTYINVTKQRWYNMPLLDIRFNGTSIGLPPSVYWFDNDSIGTFIDSGTSVMLFSPYVYSAIQSVWQSKFCNLPHVCGTDTIFDGYCFTAKEAPLLQSFPDFEFVFQGSDGTDVQLNVPASSYMMEQDGSYCWAQGQTTGVNAVLGDVFMENFYIVHDRANKRLGFAPVVAANCA